MVGVRGVVPMGKLSLSCSWVCCVRDKEENMYFSRKQFSKKKYDGQTLTALFWSKIKFYTPESGANEESCAQLCDKQCNHTSH